MSFTPLASDFFRLEAKLTETEREALAGIRAWLETDVKPLVNDHWDRAEFPHEILPAFHRQPAFGMQWDETKSFENSAVYRGWVALELARVDASIATYVGVQNGLGNFSGIVQPVVAGIIIDWTGSYAGAFWLAAVVTIFGALWWAIGLPAIRQVELD